MEPPYKCSKCKWNPPKSFSYARFLGESDLEFSKRLHQLAEKSLCERCEAMATGDPQRFGRLLRSFGDFGELRRQAKPPHTEVLYVYVKVPPKYPIGGGQTQRMGEVLRSINNCGNDQLTDNIRRIGTHLEGGTLSQENAEFLLDLLYAEIGKRVQAA